MKFTLSAIFAVTVYSTAAWLINDVLPIEVSIASPLAGTDLFLCTIFGGIISDIGSSLAIRHGGAMDGIDVAAVIFSKKLNASIGTFTMVYNTLLYIICGIVLKSWILPLYSIVTYAAGSKTIDTIVDGLDASKSAFIVTEKPTEVCKAISDEFHIGITVIDAKGYYSNSKKNVLMATVNRFQMARMKNLIHTIDENAYVTITPVSDLMHGSRMMKY